MNDDTRDALLIAVAEALLEDEEKYGAQWSMQTRLQLGHLLSKAKHEQERPADRGD